MGPGSSSPVRRRRILLVEDDDQQRATMSGMFTDHGFEVAAAAGVYEALRFAQRATPDVIVADIVLPDGDGMGLTRALRAIASTVNVPVVAITASARSIELLDPATFGAECVLLKPVTELQLIGAVERCLQPPAAPPEQPGNGVPLVAPDGMQWTVHQIQGREEGSAGALIFVSRNGYHRVNEFPAHWRSLPPEGIWALHEAAAP